MRARAGRRNREMAARVNAYLDPVAIDYERDVLPLTPAGNATERHMLLAYVRAAESRFSDQPSELAAFWAAKLGTSPEQVTAAIGDYARFSNLVRAKLMKKGGVGYVPPSPEAFPTVEEFHSFIIGLAARSRASAWLDGTSAGEQAIDELLALLIDKGVVALNIIPDRNWNIADPETRKLKVGKLHEIVRIAGELDLPINVGTEMNSAGQQAGGRLRRAGDGAGKAAIPGWRALHLRAHGHAACTGIGVSERVGEKKPPADPPRTQLVLHCDRLPRAARQRRTGKAARVGLSRPAGCFSRRNMRKEGLHG